MADKTSAGRKHPDGYKSTEPSDQILAVTVLLKKTHTHAGIDYAPGDTITGMDKSSADWLVGEGVCTITDSITKGA